MAVTEADINEMLAFLVTHPEYQDRFRAVVVGNEIPSRLDRIEATLEQLVASDVEIRNAIKELSFAVTQLVSRQEKTEGRLGNLDGRWLEVKYGQNIENWFGLYLWPVSWAPLRRLERVMSMSASGAISPVEFRALRDLDFIVSGTDADGGESLIAAEVSIHIDGNDVARVVDRARILERAGYRVKPLVGGVSIGDAAAEVAERLGVIVDLHDLPH